MIPRIAGILSPRSQAVLDFLRLMTERLATHAPGSTQVLSFPHNQPVVGIVISEGRRPAVRSWRGSDGSFVVVDGEIYDLWDDLPAEAAHTGPDNDAERLLRLDERRDGAGLARIDAAAAIAIWNSGRRELHIVRDPLGMVTTFYAMQKGDLIFASQMETLLAAGIPRRIDLHTVDYYLSKGYAPGPWIFIEGIRKIPPGHMRPPCPAALRP